MRNDDCNDDAIHVDGISDDAFDDFVDGGEIPF